MMPNHSNLNAALRNKTVLDWIRALEKRPNVQGLVEREYAEWAGLPVDEVIGALEYVTDQDSLDWVYARYYKDIETS